MRRPHQAHLKREPSEGLAYKIYLPVIQARLITSMLTWTVRSTKLRAIGSYSPSFQPELYSVFEILSIRLKNPVLQ
jgi:hypothetical protein